MHARSLIAPAAVAAAAAGALSPGVPAAPARRIVRLLAHVTLHAPADGARLFTAPASVTFSGTVSPGEPGAIAVLQREDAATANKWRRIDAGRVGAGGRYLITHTFLLAGAVNVRVLVRGGRGYAPSASEVRSYEISQPQNPLLTINASADPLSPGEHVTISGKVARAPHTAVRLFAHAVGHPGFVALARTVTDAAGRYRFPAQAPLVNTYYEVRGDGRLSAELYEGVKGLLVAGSR